MPDDSVPAVERDDPMPDDPVPAIEPDDLMPDDPTLLSSQMIQCLMTQCPRFC
ncbi:unnamed protein product [Staurois parvus]|uniref:Uncharacterized protein n=1 Tax=Staurois parvus TaxID=386267 RepID=A0ABN9BK81_9NEOB|nr:unnamed protein product [Staurois parvus]